nr:uncharacterized protein LOC124814446 [Hydra vulgaris]
MANVFPVSKEFKKYVVVGFIKEKKTRSMCYGDYMLVWLINNHINYWPSNLQLSSKIMKATQDNVTPNRSWKQLKIRILYETDSYEAAFQKIEILAYTSNAETYEDSLDESPPLKNSRGKQLKFKKKSI